MESNKEEVKKDSMIKKHHSTMKKVEVK